MFLIRDDCRSESSLSFRDCYGFLSLIVYCALNAILIFSPYVYIFGFFLHQLLQYVYSVFEGSCILFFYSIKRLFDDLDEITEHRRFLINFRWFRFTKW